jgi:GPH family glycoside/pentoside/hexuronide:cation symporter
LCFKIEASLWTCSSFVIFVFNASPSKMTRLRKLAYGFGDSGFSVTSTALALLYLDFLVNGVGLSAQWAGLAIGIGRLWDAGNDLLFGTMSDRTRTRWGRRRPYLLFGALPFGLAFIPMWLIPNLSDQAALAIYYTAAYILFDTMFTLVNTPYVALTPDLAPNYDERTSLHSYRMFFSIAFGLAGAVLPLLLVDGFRAGFGLSTQQAYAAMALLLGVLSIIPILITFAATKERSEYQALPAPTLRESFSVAFSNRAFLIAAGIYLFTWVPIDIITFVIIFLLRDVLQLQSVEQTIAFGVLFGVAALALPLWVWLSDKLDKRRAYQIGMLLLAASLLAISMVGPGQTGLAFLVTVIAGVGLSAAHALPLAIVPDTMDWDELRHGTRQEAACYAVLTLSQKLISAATITLTGVLLAASNYVPNPGPDALQPLSAIGAVRFLTGWLPALLFLAGALLASLYPITRERHARILRALEKKQARQSTLNEASILR